MSKQVADIVIAGAGICGLSAARYLARQLPPTTTIAIVSQHAAASYTSSLSTECYRDHWPTALMRNFMGRSIDLIHAHAAETNDAFRVQNKGYLYVSGAADAPAAFDAEAQQCHEHSPGSVRKHAKAAGQPMDSKSYLSLSSGADVFEDGSSLRSQFPFLHDRLTGALHARRAGWVSAQTMGACVLDELLTLKTPAGAQRVKMIRGTIDSVDTGAAKNQIRGVSVAPLADAAAQEAIDISCGVFVNATGPYLNQTHLSLFRSGDESRAALQHPAPTAFDKPHPSSLPVFSEVHSKVIFRDTLGIIPRDAPMTICNDGLKLDFQPEELEFLAEAHGQAVADKLASTLPAGAHFRPYGGKDSDAVLMLWECWHHGIQPSEPPVESASGLLDHELYPEVCLRGLAQIVPGLRCYYDDDFKEQHLSTYSIKSAGELSSSDNQNKKPYVDGGYYTKTVENVPLVGPAPGQGGQGHVGGAYLCGAVSGYGIMAGHAAGELLAMHVAAGTSVAHGSAMTGIQSPSLPAYAPFLHPLRYQWDDFTRKGGIKDQLLQAGGGQL